ncbi:hypothetical protein HDV05_004976 [Chytridiales sp. JEL 0842]|nr:hypothetical protein HDV05_004976 [Chytridiales sp. JEL 0842]
MATILITLTAISIYKKYANKANGSSTSTVSTCLASSDLCCSTPCGRDPCCSTTSCSTTTSTTTIASLFPTTITTSAPFTSTSKVSEPALNLISQSFKDPELHLEILQRFQPVLRLLHSQNLERKERSKALKDLYEHLLMASASDSDEKKQQAVPKAREIKGDMVLHDPCTSLLLLWSIFEYLKSPKRQQPLSLTDLLYGLPSHDLVSCIQALFALQAMLHSKFPSFFTERAASRKKGGFIGKEEKWVLHKVQQGWGLLAHLMDIDEGSLEILVQTDPDFWGFEELRDESEDSEKLVGVEVVETIMEVLKERGFGREGREWERVEISRV